MLISVYYGDKDKYGKKVDEELSSRARYLAYFSSIAPAASAALYLVVVGAGAVAIFVASIPALVAFPHMVFILGAACFGM